MRMIPNKKFLESMSVFAIDKNWQKLDQDSLIGEQLLNVSNNLEEIFRDETWRENYERNQFLGPRMCIKFSTTERNFYIVGCLEQNGHYVNEIEFTIEPNIRKPKIKNQKKSKKI